MAIADGAGASFPRADTLLSAQQDDANWILPAKTYAGNRYTALTQIDRTNLGALGQAWRTDIAVDGEQEAAPIKLRTLQARSNNPAIRAARPKRATGRSHGARGY